VESGLGNSSSPNDIILLPKVQAEDLSELTVGQVIGFSAFNAGTLIVDVSTDMGMGFKLGAPDSFTQPVIEVANGVHYYAVDHSPSYLWNSATWEISEALLPHIETVLAGPVMWNSSQHRDYAYPHLVRTEGTEQSQ
jgi:alanine dehydrogenase